MAAMTWVDDAEWVDDVAWVDDEVAWVDDEVAWVDDDVAWVDDECGAQQEGGRGQDGGSPGRGELPGRRRAGPRRLPRVAPWPPGDARSTEAPCCGRRAGGNLGVGRILRAPPTAAGSSRAATTAAGRRRRTFFWRRLLVVSIIAVVGALAWNATERLFVWAEPVPVSGAACGEASLQPQTIALASAGDAARRAGSPLSELGLIGRRGTSCSQVYVVRPGDTIWQIAVRLSGGGDPRPLAETLEAEIGGGALQPGQVLNVP